MSNLGVEKKVKIYFQFEDIFYSGLGDQFIQNEINRQEVEYKNKFHKKYYIKNPKSSNIPNKNNAINNSKVGLNTKNDISNDEVKRIINLKIDRDEFFKNIDELKKVYDNLRHFQGISFVNLVICENLMSQEVTVPVNYTYTNEQFDKIIQFYDYMNGYIHDSNQECGEIFFSDDTLTKGNFGRRLISLGDVCYLNRRIDTIVDIIRDNQFTPYEAMLYIHNYLTSLQYNDNKTTKTQMVIGPLLGQIIVCSGYASITKAIIDKLNMPGLKCDIQGLNNIKFDKSNYLECSHVVSLIHIKDEKYNIDGDYYNDASSDSVEYIEYHDMINEKESKNYLITNSGRFTFFMYPMCDNLLFANNEDHCYLVNDNAKTRYEQIIYNNTEETVVKHDLKQIEEYEQGFKSDKRMFNNILKSQFKPIPIDTMIRGLYNVIQADCSIVEEYEAENIEQAIYLMIMPSIEDAKYEYSPNAQNEMLQIWNRYGYFELENNIECVEKVNSDLRLHINEMVSILDQNKLKTK